MCTCAHMRMSSDALNCINRLALVAHECTSLSLSVATFNVEVIHVVVVVVVVVTYAYPVYLTCSDFAHRTLYECKIAQSSAQASSMGCNNTFYIDKFHCIEKYSSRSTSWNTLEHHILEAVPSKWFLHIFMCNAINGIRRFLSGNFDVRQHPDILSYSHFGVTQQVPVYVRVCV